MSHFIGPALPTHVQSKFAVEPEENEQYGPILPPSLLENCAEQNKNEINKNSKCKNEELSSEDFTYGPALPPPITQETNNISSDDEIVGPMPLSNNCQTDEILQAAKDLERRASRMKQKLTEKGDVSQPKRETWMLELPPDKAADFGLGPRQFRARAKPDMGDRSLWTDTPEERKRKANNLGPQEPEDLKHRATQERDEIMEKLSEKHSKKNSESLLESHQKKLKKKKKEEKSKTERRPFDRNVDLQANRFDEAQKKAIFKKAQLLNDRFSRGESKYL